MKLIDNTNPYKKLKYIHTVEFKGKHYTREEVIMPKAFFWENTPDKLEDFHTIEWRPFDNDQYQKNGHIHYYSGNNGWTKKGIMNPSNPVPKIEQVFKKTVGKDLINIF